jgi:hypothetical protein
MTTLVPPTLTAKTRSASAGRMEVTPAAWNTRATPLSARRTARRSRTSQAIDSASSDGASTPGSTASRRSSPRSRSRRATREPMKPVAPVTSVFGIYRMRWRCEPSKWRWQSRQRTASGTAVMRPAAIGLRQSRQMP